MTPKDFFNAITPYNYSAKVEGDFFETHGSVVFKMVDANEDGVVSFPEYMFFIILLSIGDK